MTTTYPLTPILARQNLRVDLSDTDASDFRWSDQSLARAIDKAVEEYSHANPFVQAVQLPVTLNSPIYAIPAGAYFVDKVELPVGRWPKSYYPFFDRKSPLIPAPNAPPAGVFAGVGTLSGGAYLYAVTFQVPGGGETTASPTVTVLVAPGNEVTLSNIPPAPYGSFQRNVYRSVAGGSSLLYAGSIPDATTTTFVDVLPDSGLGAPAPVTNTTQNIDQVELQIGPELYPQDPSLTVEISYAGKHIFDAGGTTIPERHWDALYLGALAYAMWSYLPQVNDNFLYADGHLRDRVDDTKSTIAWQTQCSTAQADFRKALDAIREESTAGITRMTTWGDVPEGWGRL